MKESIHQRLKGLTEETRIPINDFIQAYGNDDKRKINGAMVGRADILARTYNLSVEKAEDSYLFRKS